MLRVLGTLVLAYAPSLRLQSRAEMLGKRRNFEATIYALAGTGVAILALLSYLSFTGGESLTDFACIGATAAVFITAFVDPLVGSSFFCISLAADVGTNWAADGTEGLFVQLARSYELYLVALLSLYALVSIFVEVLWRLLPRELISACDQIVGVLVVAGTSAATVLYLVAAATAASYDGQLFDDKLLRGPDNRFARTSAATVMQHWLPLLVWLPLYGCRSEVAQLGARVRAWVWYVSATVPVATWLGSLGALGQTPTAAVGWLGSAPFLVSLVTVAVAPWVVLVWA